MLNYCRRSSILRPNFDVSSVLASVAPCYSASAALNNNVIQSALRTCVRGYAAQPRKKAGAPISKKLTEFKPVEKIRNVGISAHIDSGKTTVTERILYYSGRIESMHEVRGKDAVGATMDFMELERERGITIQSAATYINWRQHNINIIDTPGHVDFTVEVERALRVLDGAVLVLCAVGGVQSQTHTVNRQMARYNVPFITFINKLDRGGATYETALDGLRSKLGHNAAMLHIPIGEESKFRGIIDLVEQKAVYFDGDQGHQLRYEDIPGDMRELAKDRLDELIEVSANGDENLCELYMEQKRPSTEELKAGIRRGVLTRQFVPILCGSALKNKGVQLLMDAMIDYLPNPSEVRNTAWVEHGESEDDRTEVVLNPRRDASEPFVGMAFKLEQSKYGQLTYMRCYQGALKRSDVLENTRENRKLRIQKLVRMHARDMEEVDEAYAGDICAMFGIDCASGDTFTSKEGWPVSLQGIHVAEPVIAMSIEPTDKKKADNFLKALQRFTKEDPTFRRSYDPEMEETIVSGMGELHLDIYAQRMEREYNCPVKLGKPKVAFRETLVAPRKFDHLRKMQTGGRGQFGHVIGLCEPLPPDQNTEFVFQDEVVGNSIPKPLIPSLRKGINEMLERGPLIGYPVTGLRFRLQEGKTHEVDSTDMAMINTGKGAMQDLYDDGQWRLLEPIMKVEVSSPSEFSEAVMSMVIRRDAVIIDQAHTADGWFVFVTEVPLNNMFGFSSALRADTQGKGEFSMEFARLGYAPVTPEVQQKVVAEALADDEKLIARGLKPRRRRFDF